MGWVQSAINSLTGTSIPVTLNGTQPGNTLIAHCFSNVQQGLTISDSVNGAWSARDASFSVASPIGQGAIGRFSGIAGGNTTLTVSVGTSATLRVVFQEYSGLLVPNPLDQFNSATNLSGTTNPTTSLLAPSQTGELAVCSCVLGNGETWTAGSGWTIDPNIGTASRGYNAEYMTNVVGAQTAQFTIGASMTWGVLAAMYLPAAALGGVSDMYRQIPQAGIGGRGRASLFAQPVAMGGMGYTPANHSTSPGQGASGGGLGNVVCGGAFDWVLSPTTGLTP